MHIFLDRPTSPHIHILAFLRSITASSRPTFPCGLLQTPASSAAHMEALFEGPLSGSDRARQIVQREISRRQAERSARHGHGSTIGENISVSSTEPDHMSTGPVTVPNATERITSSFPNASSEVGAGQRRSRRGCIYMDRRVRKVSMQVLLVSVAASAVALSNVFHEMSVLNQQHL
ncbi:hypothetical protein BS47DRAFT_125932 [Hydnum rufescens UP504]|uniref:Uncharacterized protein n=1 Tax=Hydnum rufescens UP504 TaxID=1448309 RepID=A0A9P6B7K4_9AGAM|nr:hypothetical protein BS47DRAFT_125932 [Hydnum rufescens UP504]